MIAAALAAAGSAAQAAGPTRFPLAPGSAWYLADEQTAAGSTISIRLGSSGAALRGFPGAGVQAWDTGEKRWEPFLRLGAPAGTRYSVDLSREPLWRRVAVRVVDTTIAGSRTRLLDSYIPGATK